MAEINLKVPAVEKLMDYTAIGIGAVAGPMLAPWKASREGQAKLTSARYDAEVRQIEDESRASSLMMNAEAQAQARESLDRTIELGRGVAEISSDDIMQSFEFQGRKRLTNVRSVVEETADDLGDKEVSDHDPDWVARFFDHVQDVSSEDMQKIWSKILAGEVESPGRTSLRTLDTLRNMTKRDAELFKNVCSFVLHGDFVFYDHSLQPIQGLEFDNILHLEDCGLVNTGPSLERRFAWSTDREALLSYQNELLMMTSSPDSGKELAVPEILLTTAGRELFRHAQFAFHMEYLQTLSKHLESKGTQLFLLEGVEVLSNGRVRYANSARIQPKPEQIDG